MFGLFTKPIRPSDGMVEAEYTDGYIHSEKKLNDISPYLPETANVMNDIVHSRPVVYHGELVRFSVFYGGKRYDRDPKNWPEGARPARYKRMQADQTVSSTGNIKQGKTRLVGVEFGYELNDEAGNITKKVITLGNK